MRTLETQILPGHDGILPARHAGPATRSLQRSKYFLPSAKYFYHLEILDLPHGTGLAADGLGHGGLRVLHVVPARALQLEVELLALVALQTINTCNIFKIISITNIHIYLRIGANYLRLVSAFIFEIFPFRTDKN